MGATPIFAGFLFKQSTWIHDWRKRFFSLYIGPAGPRLYFSKDALSPPHGMIDLRFCLTVKSADEKTRKIHSFEVATKSDIFFMYAPSALEKDEVRERERAGGGAARSGGREVRCLIYYTALKRLNFYARERQLQGASERGGALVWGALVLVLSSMVRFLT